MGTSWSLRWRKHGRDPLRARRMGKGWHASARRGVLHCISL
ncbi:uncharacterized protein AruCF_2771 [Achromobacter ruhlandii]|nr:uncharacterized protein AruCF_2771 [Achromobacter ruhlandii]